MTFLDQLAPGRRLLWLDYVDYAGALLAGGAVPWLDVGALLAWQRKAQALLRSDVVMLPVGTVCTAWLAAHEPLRTTMASKSRALFPLKTLLADNALRTHLAELAEGLRASFTETPLALVCPSPRRWFGEAYLQAHGEGIAVGEDAADSAAVLIADFLRLFGESGVDVLLLEEGPDSEPESAAAIACYQPVLNVAAHYRWDVGLSAPLGRYAGGESGLAFVLAPRPLPGSTTGIVVPAAYWDGAAPDLPAEGLRYARIPAAAQPEAVLERLAQLR